jgi:hypothetical protein
MGRAKGFTVVLSDGVEVSMGKWRGCVHSSGARGLCHAFRGHTTAGCSCGGRTTSIRPRTFEKERNFLR